MKFVYPDDFETKLGFDSVRQYLLRKCTCAEGRLYVEKLAFSTDYSTVDKMLRQTACMKGVMESGCEYPRPSLYDLTAPLQRIRMEGSYLPADELRRVGSMIDSMRQVREFYCKQVDDDDDRHSDNGPDGVVYQYPELAAIFRDLEDYPLIYAEISRCINKFGEVADTASDALYAVRKAMAGANGAVSRAMRRAIDRASAEGLIDKSTTPAVRDGRMVIPVAAASKYSISGIVHDQSATGKTVFIEPAEVVEAANRLKELEMEERREVINVLIAISDVIRPFIPSLIDSLRLLGFLDFLMAKARFAIETGGNLPVLEKQPEIDWFNAIHPVLLLSLRQQGRQVVPLTLNLNKEQRFLIVSGPNAGGKSVVLKTVGIVQYMTQCGLLPTLDYNSHMGIFSGIFIDIGDEQSIENDLSTYSSHLRNMKYFLAHAGKSTLILADEMGSGTEPMIGGALAQSILGSLADAGCMGIVTTHYQNLKSFADGQPGFVNGAMQYDRQHLRPTFKLIVGNPGSSFAIEIARNIGLPKEVVDNAKEIVGSDYVNTEKFLLDIDRDRRYWNNKRQQIKEKEAKLNSLLAKYEDTSDDLRTKRSAILRDAQKEAKEILATANAKIEATIKAIRDAQAEKERTKELRRELEDYKKSLQEEVTGDHAMLKPLKHKSRTRKPADTGQPVAKPQRQLAVGDYVRMSDGGVTGKILGIQGKKAEVAFGSLRTYVEMSKLTHASKPKETIASKPFSVSGSTVDNSRKRQLDFKTELDVRGLRADEALQAVTYYIDDAIQFGIQRVRILHGTGHGILRTLIREQLRVNPAVTHYADEDVRFGGAGITVVEF